MGEPRRYRAAFGFLCIAFAPAAARLAYSTNMGGLPQHHAKIDKGEVLQQRLGRQQVQEDIQPANGSVNVLPILLVKEIGEPKEQYQKH